MTMTPEEICREYDQAKSPVKQIGILADLNQCSKARIKEILVAGGRELPGNCKPKKPKAEEPTNEPPVCGGTGGHAEGAIEPIIRPLDLTGARLLHKDDVDGTAVELLLNASDGGNMTADYVRGVLDMAAALREPREERRDEDACGRRSDISGLPW